MHPWDRVSRNEKPSALESARQRYCGCCDQKPRRNRFGNKYRHPKSAILLIAAAVAFLLYNTGQDGQVTALRGGGLGGTILVVGGFGFVGAAIIDRALDEDYKVFVMDSSVAYAAPQPRNKLVRYIDSDHVPHGRNGQNGQFADALAMIPNGVETVIYAAGVQDSGERHSIWDSGDGVRYVLEWCTERSVANFVMMSSLGVCELSEAEPVPDGAPKVEACTSSAEILLEAAHTNVGGSLTPAAQKALEAEMVADSICDMADIKCAVLRLSEPYGPGIDDGPVAAVVAKVVADEPIDVPEVDIPKDYIHTNDVASALIKTIRMGLSDTVLRLGICSGETTSVETWAHTAIETSGFTKSVVRLPSERENGVGMTCDVQRAWRKMAFQAGIGIPEGVASLLSSLEPDGRA